MSVGCNTLLLPVGRNPTRTHLATRPACHARPPGPAVVPNTRRGGALYPDSPPPSSSLSTRCRRSVLHLRQLASSAHGVQRRERVGLTRRRGKARLDNDMGAAHLPS